MRVYTACQRQTDVMSPHASAPSLSSGTSLKNRDPEAAELLQSYTSLLRYANVIILNKLDLLPDAVRLRQIMNEQYPGARVHEIYHHKIASDAVLSTRLADVSVPHELLEPDLDKTYASGPYIILFDVCAVMIMCLCDTLMV